MKKIFYTKTGALNVVSFFLLGLFLVVISISVKNIFPYIPLFTLESQNFTDEQVRTEAKRILSVCRTDTTDTMEVGDMACYESQIVALMPQWNILYAEAVLSTLQDFDTSLNGCHVLAHEIGYAEYRRNPKNWEKLVLEVNVQMCGSGFLHGIFEGYFDDGHDFSVSSSVIDEMCGTLGEISRKKTCAHFIAHMVVFKTNGEVAPALAVCKEVHTALQNDCYDGVFMEYHQRVMLSEHNILPAPVYDDTYVNGLAQECSQYEERGIRRNCWAEMGEVYAKQYQYDAHSVYRACYGGAKIEEDSFSCYYKGIVVLATYPLPRTPEQLSQICDSYLEDANRSMYPICIATAFDTFMLYTPKFTSRAIVMCENGPEWHKKECFRILGSKLKSVVSSVSERETLCASADEQYRPMCIGEKK